MSSSNTAAQFETALTTLKNRSQPFEEYYIDIGTTDPETREALKNAQLGDEVWTTSHGWDRERDLVLHARISEVTRLPNQRDNIRVKLTDAERIEVVFPPGMVASQDRIKQAQAADLDRMVVSLRSDVVNFIGSKEETEIKANIRTGQADLTNVIPDHEFRWQVYDKRGLPISETDEHDIIVGVGVNNPEGNAEWRTSELVTGRRYRIHPTIIGTEFKFHIYDDRGILAEESDWFDDSEDVVYTASAAASYMVIETTSNVNTRSIQVFTEAVPLILEGKKVFIDADMVDERITVTCRVRDAEGSISISKTDFTPVGETPPADFRPGSEFLRPVPDTGVYDENGNWTGEFEKVMFDGREWVNQDVSKLEKDLELEFFELDESLKERDERQQAILDGLGVPSLAETHQEILDGITSEKERYEQLVADAKEAGTNAGELAGQALSDADAAFKEAEKALSDAGSALDSLSNKADLSWVETELGSKVSQDIYNQKVTELTNATSSNSQSIEDINGTLTLKAEKTDVDTLGTRMDTAETQIEINEQGIASKAEKTYVDAVEGRLQSAESEITQTAEEVASKVSISDFNNVTGRLDTAETKISQTATEIQSKAEKSVVDTINDTVINQGTQITQNASDIQSKADQTLVDTINSTVTTQGTQISQNAELISSKASQLDVDTLNGTVTDHTTQISQNATDISSKADQSIVDDINSTVTTQGTQIIQNSSDISSKAEQTFVDGINQTVTSQGTLINQNAESITSKADKTIVDALSGTVTNQGTQISQNASDISSKADKSVVDTLSGTVETNSTNISQNATDIQS